MKKYSILLLASQVPYSRGGAELLLERLKSAFVALGHEVDIVSMPFSAEPKSSLIHQMLLWRNLSLEYVSGRKIDLVIPTKFPTYFVSHPNKVIWLIHQHRQAYELTGTRYGDFSTSDEDESVRSAIMQGDKKVLSEAKALFSISETVSRRVLDFHGLDSTPLLPPLPWTRAYQEGEKGRYILSVGRLCSTKRTDLIVRSMPYLPDDISLKIVGLPDEPNYETYLKSEIDKHHLSHRVELLGSVSEDDLISLYANCFSVFYGPYDEDFGFVTYEAAKSRKPVVTTTDSGYVQEVIKKAESGIIVLPDPEKIAEAFRNLFSNEDEYTALQNNASRVHTGEDWEGVARALLSGGGLIE
jgi:glycosyltransferase involved in cell wall biosynthesis